MAALDTPDEVIEETKGRLRSLQASFKKQFEESEQDPEFISDLKESKSKRKAIKELAEKVACDLKHSRDSKI
jgi:hypothetical protein